MKSNIVAALIIGVLAMTPVTQAAKTPAEKLVATLAQLDDLIVEVEVPKLIPSLAPILKSEVGPLAKVLLEQKLRFSDVVAAQLVAERTQKPLVQVLEDNPKADWAQVLVGAKIQLDEAVTYLEEVQSNVAFAMMDLPKKKKAKKK